MDVLLLAHANIMFSRKDLLVNTKKSPKTPTSDMSDDEETDDKVRVDELDEELDLDKTKENIWQLLTFNGPT